MAKKRKTKQVLPSPYQMGGLLDNFANFGYLNKIQNDWSSYWTNPNQVDNTYFGGNILQDRIDRNNNVGQYWQDVTTEAKGLKDYYKPGEVILPNTPNRDKIIAAGNMFGEHLPNANKAMGQAIGSTGAGIFSGLRHLGAYTPPEKIQLGQGYLGQMYQKGGNVGYIPGHQSYNNKMNTIHSPFISMANTPIPLIGIGSNGLLQKLEPGKEYNFGTAKKVVEIPMYKYGGNMTQQKTYGKAANDAFSYPILPKFSQEQGLQFVQAEKGETIYLPDHTLADVKALKMHKQMNKDMVTDIGVQGSYVFSDDPKMKLGVNSKIGSIMIGDITLGKTPFEYSENQKTKGPEDIKLTDIFFNGSKKEFTTADISKNIKKNIPLIDLKDDYFVDKSNEENRSQREDYFSILKSFNEYKKPKSKSKTFAQYGLPIQPTNNGFEGAMGYSDKVMDPFKRMDNNLKNMYGFSQPSIPSIPQLPKLYQYGGNPNIPQHAGLGDLLYYTSPIGWGSEILAKRKGKKQEKKNAEDLAKYQGIANNYKSSIQQATGLDIGTNLATYAASLNVPLQQYDDMSDQMAILSNTYNKNRASIEADKYANTNSIGGASSMARYMNPQNMGAYLASAENQSKSNGFNFSGQERSLNDQYAERLSAYKGAAKAGRNNAINTRDAQLYNANVAGIGNVGRSISTGVGTMGELNYSLDNRELQYKEMLDQKVQAAKDRVRAEGKGIADGVAQVGMTYLTGGFGSMGGSKSETQGSGFQIPTTQSYSMSPIGDRFNYNYTGMGSNTVPYIQPIQQQPFTGYGAHPGYAQQPPMLPYTSMGPINPYQLPYFRF